MTVEKREELNELITKLTNMCLFNQIPMFLVFAEETEEGTVYGHSVISPLEANVELTDDRITKYAASLNKNLVLNFKNVRFDDANSGDVLDTFVGLDEDY